MVVRFVFFFKDRWFWKQIEIDSCLLCLTSYHATLHLVFLIVWEWNYSQCRGKLKSICIEKELMQRVTAIRNKRESMLDWKGGRSRVWSPGFRQQNIPFVIRYSWSKAGDLFSSWAKWAKLRKFLFSWAWKLSSGGGLLGTGEKRG